MVLCSAVASLGNRREPVAWAVTSPGLYGGPTLCSHFCDHLLGRKAADHESLLSTFASYYFFSRFIFLIYVYACVPECIYV